MNTKLNVLVIDDDAVVGRSFDRVLSGKGYQVVTALSGEEGLNSMNEKHFDVVFTDIRMPGMDGLEVAESIRARSPLTPVVMITGYATEQNENKAEDLGVNAFVRKPLTPEIIESITLKAVNDAAKPGVPATEAEKPAGHETETVEKSPARLTVRIVAKTVAMLIAAPFIALAYIIALPLIGFYQFAKLAYEAYARKYPAAGKLRMAGLFLKNVGLFLASPFIALAYVIALPFVGFFMFTKLALEANAKRRLNA